MRLLSDELCKLLLSLSVLRLIGNIRVIIKIRDTEVPGQILEAVGAAGCAAAVEKYRRYFSGFFVRGNYFIEFFLIIYFVRHLLLIVSALKLSVAAFSVDDIHKFLTVLVSAQILESDIYDPLIRVVQMIEA